MLFATRARLPPSKRQTNSRPTSKPAGSRPAFCDVQINGCFGQSFGATLTHEQIQTVVATCREHGISELCPTLITASANELTNAFQALHRACESDADLARGHDRVSSRRAVFVAARWTRAGAHPLAHIRDPNWDEFRRFQDAAGGRIRMVTLAPERPGAIAMIERLTAANIVVAIGHTAAAPREIRAAVAAGARLSTHLGNGSHAMLPRHENYLWEQMAADDLWASIIVGRPSSAGQRCAIDRTGEDAGPLAAHMRRQPRSPDCRRAATINGTTISIFCPKAKLSSAGTPYLAGSWAFTDVCVRNVMALAGYGRLPTRSISRPRRPRRILGLPPAHARRRPTR